MPLLEQNIGPDYGLFSIAFATSLAFGKDPSNTTYDSTAKRPHLIKCLTPGKIVPFTKVEGKRVVRCKSNTHNIEIFCSSRTPWTAHPAGNYMFKVNYRNTRIRCEICSKF